MELSQAEPYGRHPTGACHATDDRDFALLFTGAMTAAANAQITVRTHFSDDTLLRMGPHTFEGGKTLNLSVGIGNARIPSPGRPAERVLDDRGSRSEPHVQRFHPDPPPRWSSRPAEKTKNARGSLLTPSYAPSIYRATPTDAGLFRITDVITLKDRDGTPAQRSATIRCATPPPRRRSMGHGKPLDRNSAHGIDAEAIIRLTDGTFWVSDEYAPSIVHVSSDGRIITRHVPKGTEAGLPGALRRGGSLPAILAKRQPNRGIEALPFSPDEQLSFFILQNPLANPDSAAFSSPQRAAVPARAREHADRRRIRLRARRSADVLPRSVRRANRCAHQRTDGGRHRPLIVLERTEQTTKLYEIDLGKASNISGSRWDQISDPRLHWNRSTSSRGDDRAG